MKTKEIIRRFTSNQVPKIGPEEDIHIDPPYWQISEKETPENYPGDGLYRHTMLYIGEGCNRIFLIHAGKVIWSYSTGTGWELDDVFMLSNYHIVFSRMSWAGEVTPEKRLIWRYNCPKNTEVHSIQPVGEDNVLLIRNGIPPRILLIQRKTGKVLKDIVVPYDGFTEPHGQFRRIRYTKDHTFLLPYLSENKVVEYDEKMNVVWQYNVKGPWAAIRLKNENTLITAEGEDRTIEVTRDGRIAWELRLEELPEPYRLAGSQSCERLENGNTILCSRGDNGSAPQLVEVTPDKKVIWCIQDWKNLGPATAIQILTEPDVSEIPGRFQR